MKKTLILLLLIFSSCADMNYQMAHNIQFKTVIDGTSDPTFNFNPPKRIGFYPSYWTANGKQNNISSLIEKQIFFYAKQELEKRGYQVDYVAEEKLRELPNSGMNCSSCTYDLILTLFYSDKQEQINFAGGSSGGIGWNQYGGGGSYSSTGPHSVPYYNLFIRFNMFSGGKEIWFGSITQGTSEPQLTEKAEGLVGKIFSKKYPEVSQKKQPAENSADSWINQGKQFESQNNFLEADKAYSKAIEINPNSDIYWMLKFKTALRLNNLNDQRKAINKACELNPTSGEIWFWKGILFKKDKLNDEALTAFNRSIELNPKVPVPFFEKGRLLGYLGKRTDAIAPLKSAVQIDPACMNYRAKFLLLNYQQQYKEALALLENTRRNGDEIEYLYNKTCTFAMMGDRKNALNTLTELLTADPQVKEGVKNDHDFENLWADREFKKLIE